MIQTKILEDGRTKTWSDRGLKIQQETGVIYDDAIDTVPHIYTETDIPIEGDPAPEDYEQALEVFGV